jgi:hypothetical protein
MDILLHRRMLVLVVGAALALAVAFLLPKNSSAVPEFGESEEFLIEGACDFPVLLTATPASRGTVRELPGGVTLLAGRTIGTFTNLEDPDKQFTDVAGGSAFVRSLENGDLLVVTRGHTGLIVPGEGIFMAIGRAKITVEPPGTPGSALTILGNRGRLIDVCARLA